MNLDKLTEALETLETRRAGTTAVVETPVGSLACGRLHEWFADTPPISILIDTVRHPRKPNAAPESSKGRVSSDFRGRGSDFRGGLIVWIGRAVWPYPIVMQPDVAAASVFVDPPDLAARLWAIDLSLRSGAARAVVADGTGLPMQATRRLQLAAESGHALALIARPTRELTRRSAAAYRWRVIPTPSPRTDDRDGIDDGRDGTDLNHMSRYMSRPTWTVELIRSKDAFQKFKQRAKQPALATPPGALPGSAQPGSRTHETPSRAASQSKQLHSGQPHTVEWNDEGFITLAAGLADRTATPAKQSA